MNPFCLFASFHIHSFGQSGLSHSFSIVIRHIWWVCCGVYASCDNKISCPFRHCTTHITHKMDVWHVKPMTTMSACHLEMLRSIFFYICFFLLRFVAWCARSEYKQLEAFRSKNTFNTHPLRLRNRSFFCHLSMSVGMESVAEYESVHVWQILK